MKENIIGVDIGGTKCAVTYGQQEGNRVTILDKECFRTSDVTQTIEQLKTCIRNVMGRHGLEAGNTRAIGISCGGPLDSRTGVVMSPPNLPGWDNIPIVGIFEKEFGIRTAIHNDANACALAEWQFGAGAGTRNMIFLTFGTGLGAGLILDGRIYTGTNDNAGELGHIRLSDFGPVGYGKCGSFEGFCSGGGIRQRVQIVFYTIHVTMGIENDHLIEGSQPVQRLQRAKIAVAGHGVDLHFGVQGQRLFQVAQAISQKDNGSCIAFCVQDALHCTGAVVAVAQDQKFRHGTTSSLFIRIKPLSRLRRQVRVAAPSIHFVL